MIFETHAHYDDDRFKEDRDVTIQRVCDSGVAPIINVGASISSTKTTMELAEKYDFIYSVSQLLIPSVIYQYPKLKDKILLSKNCDKKYKYHI